MQFEAHLPNTNSNTNTNTNTNQGKMNGKGTKKPSKGVWRLTAGGRQQCMVQYGARFGARLCILLFNS
jgi:hypothetical protein